MKTKLCYLACAALLLSPLLQPACRGDDAASAPALHLENAVVVPHGDTISC